MIGIEWRRSRDGNPRRDTPENIMDKTLFDATEVTNDRLSAAAAAFTDSTWARHCLERGKREMATGTMRLWVPRLTLVASSRLQRTRELLPVYEQFLSVLDAMPKPDWHKAVSEQGLNGNLLAQSGRLAQTVDAFNPEFDRVVRALGPWEDGIVADIGCGGGLWAINLAKMGYRVVGTEHHEFLVETARQNAINAEVTDNVEFVLDDICQSTLPAGMCSRALCISVTPTLPGTPAFENLIGHLHTITRDNGESSQRRVILGSNRWGPSRMAAVESILEAVCAEAQSDGRQYANALRRLGMIEVSWWLQPHHVDMIRTLFDSVELIGETYDPVDGKRVELLLQ